MGPAHLGHGRREHRAHGIWCPRRSGRSRCCAGNRRLSGRSATGSSTNSRPRGQADLIREFTFEFPTRVIARLLGLPESRSALLPPRGGSDHQLRRSKSRARCRQSKQLADYFLGQIELAPRDGRPTTSSAISVGSRDRRGEAHREAIYSFLRLLLPAGLETTYRSSGNLLYLLLRHPDQLRAVQQDHELIPQAIEEGLRFETPPHAGAAVCHRGHRTRGRRHSPRRGARRVSRFGQPRRNALGAVRRNSTSSAPAAAHQFRRGRAHLSRSAPRAGWKPGSRWNAC